MDDTRTTKEKTNQQHWWTQRPDMSSFKGPHDSPEFAEACVLKAAQDLLNEQQAQPKK
ncbi:MAG: hypothetical protein ACYC5N_08840 [Endomicrobiales bacterium]